MMDAVVSERWREERRDRILQAASRVFSRHSYESASMDVIAQEAGVGKPTVYRYFPSKEALFAAVFIQALDHLEARLDRVLDREDGIGPRLTSLVTEIVPMFRDHLVSLRLLGQSEAAVDQSKRRIFRERRARIGSYLARAIDAGVRQGELRAVSGARLAQLVLGMIWSATAASDGPAAEIAREIADVVLHGIALATPESDGHAARSSEPLPQSAGRQAARRQANV